MNIYLALSITGRKYYEVMDDLEHTQALLVAAGYTVYHPMIGKEHLKDEIEFKAQGYVNPVSCDHAIFGRDMWMVSQADVVFVNLVSSQRVSIGAVMEIAWASLMKKHIVVSLEEGNIHNHSFILQAATIVYRTSHEAIEYLSKLGRVVAA